MDNQFKGDIHFFNVVLGIYCRLREFHFNTIVQAEHNLTNDLMPALLDYTDSVMENQMGISDSRPGMDIIEFSRSTKTSITDCLKELSDEISAYKQSLDSVKNAGTINVLDDFSTDVNKWIYLSKNK